MKKLFWVFLAAILMTGCTGNKQQPTVAATDWANTVVYEMNVRQYTPEGTFAAAQRELPRLKELGIDVVWLMPIYPIGVEGRKGTLGSYYAIKDYTDINPEFGTLADFDNFLAEAHRLGLKVIIDWVANHTSPDARWVTESPASWYERDAQGGLTYTADWSDTANLNYADEGMVKGMQEAMHFWLQRGVDGFRCDMACEVPLTFWEETIKGIKAQYPDVFMLAEGEEPLLQSQCGFHSSYSWELHHMMNDIAKGNKSIDDLVSYIKKDTERHPEGAYRLMFITNHDENSWAGTEFERMGDATQAMAVLTFTLPGGQPLIYTGQEMGWNHRFQFFEKDPIPAWKENAHTDFYRDLIAFKHSNPALSAGIGHGEFEIISTDNNTLTFTRSVPGNKVEVSVQLEAPWRWEYRTVCDPVDRVEPLSWWTGMSTPLQLMIHGTDIASYDLTIEGGEGVQIAKVHKAESPNYLFVDVTIDAKAQPGTYNLVFTKEGKEFRYPYQLQARREGSAERTSFTTADMVYLLMPDRFANGDPSNDSTPDTDDKADRDAFFGRHGGDIQGIIDHLDYIADLGATARWSTPLLLDNAPKESYHGYAASDYYQIDPRFGSNALYRELVSKAHDKGIKMIMDIVTNHCGTEHWWMQDLPFHDWIHQFDTYTGTNICFSTNMDPNASKQDLYIQESGWFVPSMVDMNLNNEYTLRYFIQWAIWWIEYADLDGLRVDTYPYNEKEPMSRWCEALMREYPNFNIVGECWTSSAPQLAYWQGGNANKDGFDSHLPAIMDFPLHDAMRAGLSERNPGWGQGMTRVYDCLSHDFLYHDLSNMMIFAGNHDTDRLGDVVGRNYNKAKLGITMLATMRGIPQLFAGDEMMFYSKDLSQGHGGLRVDFPGGWAGDKADYFTPEGREQHPVIADMYDYSRTLFQWRKSKEVIHNGKTLHFMTRDNTYAYFRYNDKEVVFVYINNSQEPKHLPWSYYKEISEGLTTGRNVITGEKVTLSDDTVVGPEQALVVEFVKK